MRNLMETVRLLFENGSSEEENNDSDGYRIEYQHSGIWGTDQWLVLKTLTRGEKAGPAFDTLCWFPKGTSRDVVKRHFWKTYKIDIDKLPKWERLVNVQNPPPSWATD